MAGGSGGQDNLGTLAAINVTPLVDVMLVLLVIFMVTAPLLQQGVEVDLPKASNAPLKGNTEQVVVSVDRDEHVFLGAGNQVPLDELPKRVSAILATRDAADRKVYIKADTGLRYGAIMELMGRLHEAGIDQIGLVSAPLQGPAH